MQIRLTVLAPHAGHGSHTGHGGHSAARACDVLVTAPAGTALAAVASGLAAAVTGPETSSSGTTVLYAGPERLDAQRCLLGEPPLVDGAVLSLQVPGPDDRVGEAASARLHVVAGPDAGGVHLLHGGAIRIGRSVDADVPLDDPDVSRAHCTVTVGEDGRVTVSDLGSTNGTTLDGAPVGARPVRLLPGSLLRLGESALRLTAPGDDLAGTETVATAPDGEGHLRVAPAARPADEDARAYEPAGDVHHAEPYAEDSPGHARAEDPAHSYGDEDAEGESDGTAHSSTRQTRRQSGKRGLGAWARRLAGGREEQPAPRQDDRPAARTTAAPAPVLPAPSSPSSPSLADAWPDPATVLLTALGPGPRLWERPQGHPESLVVRLGTADRAELSGVPVTVGLREAGSLGLAGPADRLAGLARSVVAQLAALHSPADLEIVLICADRNRSLEERRRAWGWLGWLPHVRPAHGQDCRLLLAYDREQAQARTTELTRRLDDGPLGPGWPSADRETVAEAAARHDGPSTLVVVDGDPGSAALRETVARLAGVGAAAGIHVLCLAEAPAATPESPVTATYESACVASLAFRECGAVALLSGDVATALRLVRASGGQVAGHGTVGVVDAVSVAWAERFGRALAPLRTETNTAPHGRAAALPPSSRLLDELGLARATPASLLARWASAGDGTVVLGTGPRGPLAVDLTQEGPHLLIEGPAGSGRTELLRAVAASLAAGGRPDRLGLLLVDGAGGERGEGLAACTELPHVSEHLVASDPVRMREFAQALGAELKRRAEILGDGHFADRQGARAAERLIGGQRTASAAESVAPRVTVRLPEPGDLDGRASGRTLRTGDGTVGALPSGRTPYRTLDDGTLGDRPSGRTVHVDATRPEGDTGANDLNRRASGRIPHPGTSGHGADDLDGRSSGRITRPGADDLDGRTSGRAGADDLGRRTTGRTAYPGADDLDSRTSGRAGADDLGRRPSGRIAYPSADDLDGRTSGRVAHPGAEDLGRRASGRIPHPGTSGHGADDLDGRSSDRIARPGADDLGRRASGRIPYPGAEDLDGGSSGRVRRAGAEDLDGRGSGQGSPYPGADDLGRRPSGRIPHPGTSGQGPYPGADDLGRRASGRIPHPGAEDLDGRTSGRVAHPGADDLGRRPSGRIPHPGTSDHASGRTPYPGDDLDGRVSGQGPYPGADDLGRRPSGRIPYPGSDDLDGRGSGRVAHPGAEDLGRRPSGRIPHPGTSDHASGRTPYPAGGYLPDTPSGRLPRRDGGPLEDRPSSRTHRAGDGDLGGRPSSRTFRTGDGELTDRPSSRTFRTGDGDLVDRSSGRTLRSGPSGRTLRTGDGEPVEQAAAAATSGARVPRPEAAYEVAAGSGPLPRLVVLVDDFDALVAPALGAPGRPAAGSVVRALEAVARHGERLGVHLVATSARPDRTSDTELAHGARLRVVLDPPPAAPGPDVPTAGRGRLGHPDGRLTPFQTGRVSGRIPRTATLRPVVVPLEWERMGDPPARRPVRELGNGPTDLALLASALDRAARSVEATPIPPLAPATRT
ncbi:FHA domain-containing protein [Streptomyces sp. NPDC056144]|uniref:FHA domain-containing protein n=1 Tax=unclassified Streptomyces TaxID=2593676 RepID=UPI0035D84074